MEKEKNMEKLCETLKEIPADKRQSISKALCAELVGKGLSFAQAEAMLDYAKVLLRNAVI